MENVWPDDITIRVAFAGAEYVARLEKAVKTKTDRLIEYTAEDFGILEQWVKLFICPEESVIETLVTETVIREHRMQGEFMLLGLVEDVDCGGAACWSIVGADDDDPLCDTTAQMNFLKHFWMPSMASSLVEFIAELTPWRALLVRPGVLACLDELAGELVELDKLNADSSRSFASRPNARMELFKDVSHDVLKRRILAGMAAREEAGLEA